MTNLDSKTRDLPIFKHFTDGEISTESFRKGFINEKGMFNFFKLATVIVAIVGGAIANVGVGLTLFLWLRGEASADRRENSNEIKQLRRDLIDCVRAIEVEVKDFHGRLCAIEANRGK